MIGVQLTSWPFNIIRAIFTLEAFLVCQDIFSQLLLLNLDWGSTIKLILVMAWGPLTTPHTHTHRFMQCYLNYVQSYEKRPIK